MGWKKFTVNDLKKRKGGSQLLKRYSSFLHALKVNYPEYNWDEYSNFNLRKTVPRNYWKSNENCKEFLELFAKEFNIVSDSDWNRITKRDIIYFGGSGLIYRKDIRALLFKFYPNVQWNSILSPERIPRGYFDNVDHVHQFVRDFEYEFRIVNLSDWFRISKIQICSVNGGQSILNKFGGMVSLLKFVYPNEKWDEKLFSARDKRAAQRLLFLFLQEIFYGVEIIEEFIHDKLTRQLGRAVEFDIFIPKYNIGIEYHGKHHYADIPSFGFLEMYQNRDSEKFELCKNDNVTLIVIPFWWDNCKSSIQGSLACVFGEKFPDLFPRPFCKPIPEFLPLVKE